MAKLSVNWKMHIEKGENKSKNKKKKKRTIIVNNIFAYIRKTKCVISG